MYYLPPEGPSLKLLIIVTVLLAIATIAILLRIWARLIIKGFGLDDWLMILGWALLVFCTIADYLCIGYGVGAHADRLTEYQIEQAKKWFLVAGITYAAATAPVKASICVVILRITRHKVYRWILYVVIFLSVSGSFIRVVTYLARCQPLEAAWNPLKGKCGSTSILTNVSYFFGAICILTDWVCAILPAFILWNVQLSTKLKAYIGIMLALGVLASVATIVRMKYLLNYQDPDDYVYGITPIAIWSNMECCVGIVAGSLATMRPLLRLCCLPGLNTSGISKTAESGKSHGLQLHRSQRRSHIPDFEATYRTTIKRDEELGEDGISEAGSSKQMLPVMGMQILRESEYEVTVEDGTVGRGDGANKRTIM